MALNINVISASNAAKDTYLNSIDPEPNSRYPQSSVASPPNSAEEPPPPPPPAPMNERPRVLKIFWRDEFFKRLGGMLKGSVRLQVKNDPDPDRMDFSNWFNYFYAEASPMAQAVDDEDLGRIFALVLDLKSVLSVNRVSQALQRNFEPPVALNPAFADQLQNGQNTAAAFGILDFLLRLGFEMPETGQAGRVLFKSPDDSSIHLFGPDFALRSAMSVPVAERACRGEFVFAYRGDSRTPEQVIQHGGAKCRADLGWWRTKANIDKPWHPWNDVNGDVKKMWIRKGNRDNDYYTVNSIAMDFHISCAYPIFRSKDLGPDFLGDINNWAEEQRLKLRASNKANFCLIKRRRDNQEVYVLFDTSQVYVCLLQENSEIAKTYATGANYPESAIREVPLTSMVACIKIQRFHIPPLSDNLPYSSTETDPAMTIEVKGWQWVNGETSGKNALGLENPKILEARMNNLKGKSFDISHTQYKGENTYFDTSTKRFPPVQHKAPVKATVR